jgi:hypothetical protein
VAGLTEMSISPAEPLGYIAAELAFKLDEVSSMFRTVLDSATHAHGRAFSANQLLFLKVLIIVLGRFTIFHSSEVWLRAFEAAVVRELVESKSFQIVVKTVAWLFKPLALVEVLELCALHSLLDD